MEALEEYLSAIPAHHGTEKLRLQVTKQIARLRQETKQAKRKTGKSSQGVKKIADLLVFLVGPPGSGKSDFLRRLVGEGGRKDMGVVDMHGMKVQLVELPSSVPGQRGMPQPVLPDLVLVFVTKDFPSGEDLVSSFGLGMLGVPRVQVSREGVPNSLPASVSPEELEKVIVQKLGIRRVYLKSPQSKQPDPKPVIFRSEVTVGEVASFIHKSLAENFKYARVWGSTSYPGEKVGRSYKLADGDVVEIRRGARGRSGASSALARSCPSLFTLAKNSWIASNFLKPLALVEALATAVASDMEVLGSRPEISNANVDASRMSPAPVGSAPPDRLRPWWLPPFQRKVAPLLPSLVKRNEMAPSPGESGPWAARSSLDEPPTRKAPLR